MVALWLWWRMQIYLVAGGAEAAGRHQYDTSAALEQVATLAASHGNLDVSSAARAILLRLLLGRLRVLTALLCATDIIITPYDWTCFQLSAVGQTFLLNVFHATPAVRDGEATATVGELKTAIMAKDADPNAARIPVFIDEAQVLMGVKYGAHVTSTKQSPGRAASAAGADAGAGAAPGAEPPAGGAVPSAARAKTPPFVPPRRLLTTLRTAVSFTLKSPLVYAGTELSLQVAVSTDPAVSPTDDQPRVLVLNFPAFDTEMVHRYLHAFLNFDTTAGAAVDAEDDDEDDDAEDDDDDDAATPSTGDCGVADAAVKETELPFITDMLVGRPRWVARVVCAAYSFGVEVAMAPDFVPARCKEIVVSLLQHYETRLVTGVRFKDADAGSTPRETVVSRAYEAVMSSTSFRGLQDLDDDTACHVETLLCTYENFGNCQRVVHEPIIVELLEQLMTKFNVTNPFADILGL